MTTDAPSAASTTIPNDVTDPANEPSAPGVLGSTWFSWLAFWLGLAALPTLIAFDVPFVAWAIAFGLWLANRIVASLVTRFALGMPKHLAVGAAGLAMMLRVWISAGILFFVSADLEAGNIALGFGRPDIGVPAIVVFMALFTVDIVVRATSQLVAAKAAAAEDGDPDEGKG